MELSTDVNSFKEGSLLKPLAMFSCIIEVITIKYDTKPLFLKVYSLIVCPQWPLFTGLMTLSMCFPSLLIIQPSSLPYVNYRGY